MAALSLSVAATSYVWQRYARSQWRSASRSRDSTEATPRCTERTALMARSGAAAERTALTVYKYIFTI